MTSLLDTGGLGEWQNQAEQIESAMNDYWLHPARSRNRPCLQNPAVWRTLRSVLDNLLRMPAANSSRRLKLSDFELFLLYSATHLYEVGWQGNELPEDELPYEQYYARSGEMIRGSKSGKYRFGLSQLDPTVIERLAQLCVLVGQTTLTNESAARVRTPWEPNTLHMDYLAALLQLANRLLTQNRANNLYITHPDFYPRNIVDARLALALLPIGSPYIAWWNITGHTLTSVLSLHPDDKPHEQKIKDLFLEPIRKWSVNNSAWMAERYHFVLSLSEPEAGPENHEPLAKTCSALIPFLQTFEPTRFQPVPFLRDTGEQKLVRTRVVICYSPEDKSHLEHLQTHLAPYRQHGIDEWDMTKIDPGELWESKIEEAIASAKVAILLVSAAFMASTSINEKQVAPLLAATKTKEVTIIPVRLNHSIFEKSPLGAFQPVNKEKVVAQMSVDEAAEIWQKVAESVYEKFVADTQ